jgi:tRNA threonylcarbamoyl adenosine modification protein YeaZ
MAARLGPGGAPASGWVLAIHSAWDTVGAALLNDGECAATRQLEGGRSGILLPAAIRDLLEQAGVQPSEIRRLAVCIGPGSFTGIKVGLATAFGLSRALKVSVTGVDAMEILAAQAPAGVAVVTLLPAGRGELYLAVYGALDGELRPVLRPPCLLTPQEARPELQGRTAIHLGCEALVADLLLARVVDWRDESTGDASLSSSLKPRASSLRAGEARAVFGVSTLLPGDPARLAETLGRQALLRPEPGPGRIPDPLYLRRTWAEEARDKKLAGGGG